MTLLRPTIMLSRLVVTKSGTRVFDEKFHPGLNVIRGENGSGKTTIADLAFFALGGDTPNWRAEAALCEYVFAELLINGEPLTLRRQIEHEKLRPMAIFWGSFEGADNEQTNWQLYPYAGTSGKESFSQVIFSLAGIPEIRSTSGSKVTLHQVLRLVYVDQKTDYEQLFRADPFDPQLTREAVGDLLCGVYDDRIYEAELERAYKESQKASLQSELKTIFTLLGDQTIPNLEWIEAQKATHRLERQQAYAELSKLQPQAASAPVDPIAIRRSQIAGELAKQNQLVRNLHEQITQAQIGIVDRKQFLLALQARMQALAESESAHESLGAFSFQFCPACYAPLSGQDGVCHLCKSATESRPGQNLLRLRRELEQQIRESRSMQEKITAALNELSLKLRPEQDRQLQLQLQYDELSTTSNTGIAAAAADIHRRIGYLDRTIENLEERSRLAARVSLLSESQAELARDISKLNDEIAARRAAQEQKKHDISALIAGITVEILKHDLPREGAFSQATIVQFDFGGNRISIDGRSTFAASSNVYLKNAFHLALLNASTQRDYMRYPRLAIFDNVEDKGMEPERSHNFQRIVRELSQTTDVDHQIILFTSMIAPEFENEPQLLVGPRYTHQLKTLKVPPVAGTTLQFD